MAKETYTARDIPGTDQNFAEKLGKKLGKKPSEIIVKLATPGTGDYYLQYVQGMAKLDPNEDKRTQLIQALSHIEKFENSRIIPAEENDVAQ